MISQNTADMPMPIRATRTVSATFWTIVMPSHTTKKEAR